MNIIVPMAGAGSRFSSAGYTLPKPLIPVDGLPMVVRAIGDLPSAERIIFLVHRDHVAEHQIDQVLRSHFSDCEIVVVPGLTEGQACTVRLAAEAFSEDTDVLVAACDNTHVYDEEVFIEKATSGQWDGLIWTYRGDNRVLPKPTSYGWVATDQEDQQVTHVSCKKPISEHLLSDHVVSGFFWFQSAYQLFDAIDALVASDERINNEFYLDVVPNRMISTGNRFDTFEVEKYIGWGTPEELRDYQRWEKYFAQQQQRKLAA
ncbi:Bifunctional protein GlmU [Bremerella volcania]|uniref:Bifunctional protein GlmU n=1 Tax=Bremerella volcania TaxID=2527984 RepID=A0A518C361_9BACT|nr:NTP transferase domain-containing protein [Bremerella volcania]QDU73665.1 Bifunctional protein GlmU [Bremerella volcania]